MPGMLAAFKAHGTQRVLFGYGRDDAGDRAADKLAPRLMAEGIECWRIQFVKQAGIDWVRPKTCSNTTWAACS